MPTNQLLAARIAGLLLLATLALGGCATTGGVPEDPLEGLNRGIYTFNDTVDKALIKPVAQGYQAVMPSFADRAVTNFFGNLNDLTVAINDLLQLKILHAFTDVGRVVLNSTLGLAGLIDIASDLGIEKRQEDFGQTLGYWGLGSGPYLVLPFLGPSTFRDAAGLAVDSALFDPIFWIDDDGTELVALGVKLVDKRADLLRTERVVEEAALDPYAFLRDAYLQRRSYLIHDGNPPLE